MKHKAVIIRAKNMQDYLIYIYIYYIYIYACNAILILLISSNMILHQIQFHVYLKIFLSSFWESDSSN